MDVDSKIYVRWRWEKVSGAGVGSERPGAGGVSERPHSQIHVKAESWTHSV